MILAIVSAGIISIIFIFALVTLIPRFKTRCLRIFVGVLSLFNGNIPLCNNSNIILAYFPFSNYTSGCCNNLYNFK
jgi:hypothetical protein